MSRSVVVHRPAPPSVVRTTLAAAVALLATTHAAATPVEQWQIIEGHGLTDDYAYLGMTLAEAQSRVPGAYQGQCYFAIDRQRCDLRPQSDAPELRIFFDGTEPTSLATSIQFFFEGATIAWPTTRGAVAGMAMREVRALYPGSVVRDGRTHWGGVPTHTRTMTSRDTGYAYQRYTFCVKDEGYCDGRWTQEVFPIGGRPEE